VPALPVENGPAIHGWVNGSTIFESPKGTKESSYRPYGTNGAGCEQPSAKALGYFPGGTGYQPAKGFRRQVAAQHGLVARSTHQTNSLPIRPVLRLPIGRHSQRVVHTSSEPSQNQPHIAYLPGMKKCTYCGKVYPDEASLCAIDHQPLLEIVSNSSDSSSINAKPVITDEAIQGRRILAVLLGLWLLLSLIFIGQFGSGLFWVHCVRLLIAAGLSYAIWIGQAWARWLTVCLCAVAIAFSIYLRVAYSISFNLTVVFLLALLYGLAFSKKVDAFLKYQKPQNSPTL
jgi:hypothetical protein